MWPWVLCGFQFLTLGCPLAFLSGASSGPSRPNSGVWATSTAPSLLRPVSRGRRPEQGGEIPRGVGTSHTFHHHTSEQAICTGFHQCVTLSQASTLEWECKEAAPSLSLLSWNTSSGSPRRSQTCVERNDWERWGISSCGRTLNLGSFAQASFPNVNDFLWWQRSPVQSSISKIAHSQPECWGRARGSRTRECEPLAVGWPMCGIVLVSKTPCPPTICSLVGMNSNCDRHGQLTVLSYTYCI